jgi:hypothetical protein
LLNNLDSKCRKKNNNQARANNRTFSSIAVLSKYWCRKGAIGSANQNNGHAVRVAAELNDAWHSQAAAKKRVVAH